MNDKKFSADEKALLEQFDQGQFESDLSPQRQQELQAIAETTFKKDKRINIRISTRDLEAIQRKALKEGVPYQTLVSSVLHKYVAGSLKDVEAGTLDRK